MAEVWGGILRALGSALGAIYGVVPSYVVAIMLLTVAVRVVLIPLTLKQIRSMSAMQKIQPEIKRLQQKHKGNRQKLNEEMMKLYKEHGVNPLGGCFPLVMQAPVFIALYSVLRAAVPAFAVPAIPNEPVTIEITRATFCHPAQEASIGGPNPTLIRCETTAKDKETQQQEFAVSGQWTDRTDREGKPIEASFVSRCVPEVRTEGGQKVLVRVGCSSPVGTGHLPRDGKLFRDIIQDKTTFLGIHLACSPTQGGSKTTIRQCAPKAEDAGGSRLVGYYALVLLMAGTTYYQQRQMSQRATGPQAKQMQMMGRIMPVFLGFISLNIPSGVIVYWVVSNLWTIGQQTVFFRRGQMGPPPEPPEGARKKRK